MNDWTASTWLAIGQFVWLIALTVGTWLRKPGDDATREVRELKEAVLQKQAHVAGELLTLHGKHALLDERMKGLPTHTEIRQLIEAMADLRGKFGALEQGLERQQRALDLIQEFMSKR